jgi:glucose/arabinose dehydrogenase
MTEENKKRLFTPGRRLFLIILLLTVPYGLMVAQYLRAQDRAELVLDTPTTQLELPLTAPQFSSEQLVTGYSHVWDMVFVNDTTILFDERSGQLHTYDLKSNEAKNIGVVPNVRAEGEGGLLGLALDKDFGTNRYVYACYNHNGPFRTVRVTRFKLSRSNEPSGYTDIISDIESKAGRHSGCRMAMDSSGHLWIGTGDSAIGNAPQNASSLAGKVLRVDRNGKGVEGNAKPPFDDRIYNFGHRNIQGLVLFEQPNPNGAVGLTAEHGPDKQDEINWIVPGNFGWDPDGGGSVYDESVGMTDTNRYSDAVPVVWNSGDQTIAVAGLALLTHERWQAWKGWAAMAVLKGKHLRLLDIKDDGTVETELEILKEFGRLRAVRQAPNGDLYVTTDNGNSKDGIIRVSPK